MNAQEYKKATQVKGLEVGVKAPDFKAIDQNNENFSLSEALKKGPVVMVFFRGFWCPYCNKHIKKLQDSLSLLQDKGATVIAISPEKPEYLQKTVKKTKAEFRLLYDKNYAIATAYKVKFLPSNPQLFIYNSVLHGQLKKTHSDASQQLPVPATFVIDKSGTIVWRQFDPNYKNRSNVSDIAKALANLKEE